MPYYKAGDYYRGDYYQGDFLGIGKALKGAAKAVGGVVKGITGIVAGSNIPVVSQAASIANKIVSLGTPSIAMQGPTPYINIAPMAPPGGQQIPKPGASGVLERFLPGGATGYYTRRRMNMTNVKALRRAGRRVKGFLRIASRLGALPVNRGKGKTLFKRKRR